ncbi:MarR family winged helix-turn-helix transcriptional regulator [Arthrobacter sp. Z1-9]
MTLNPGTAANLVSEIFDLQRAVRCITSTSSRGEGTGPALHFVLRLVNEGECRATRLAGRLGVGTPVLSRQIAELEEQGLVVRRKDPDDGRAHVVALTPLGVDKLEHLQSQWSTMFQEHLLDWTEDDARRAGAVLRQLTESLRKK